MNASPWIRVAAAVVALILGMSAIHGWFADQRDRAALAMELAATKRLLADAETRQQQRDSALAQQLTQLEALKRSVITPSQIIHALPQAIPLPSPIRLQPESSATAPEPNTGPSPVQSSAKAPTTATNDAVIPAENLKPLYDFAVDCKACQAKLAAAQGDLADEKVKSQALAKDRDAALQVAKGGSFWRRTGRAVKWFAIGAAAGAMAARAAH